MYNSSILFALLWYSWWGEIYQNAEEKCQGRRERWGGEKLDERCWVNAKCLTLQTQYFEDGKTLFTSVSLDAVVRIDNTRAVIFAFFSSSSFFFFFSWERGSMGCWFKFRNLFSSSQLRHVLPRSRLIHLMLYSVSQPSCIIYTTYLR